MGNTSRILDLKYKLMTIELLNLTKNYYTYRELSQMIGLPETVLSRYVKGHVLPTIERAQAMNNVLQKILRLDQELQERIQFDDYGYFDNTKIVGDTLFLERAVQYAVDKFAGRRVTKVLTAAVDGITLSTLLAHRLGVKLVIAKKEREVGVREFIEEMFILPNTAVTVSLYIPRGSIRKGDSILIVDDVIDSGETQSALIRMVARARSEVTGIFALVSIGDEWEEKLSTEVRCPIEVILKVPPKERTSS